MYDLTTFNSWTYPAEYSPLSAIPIGGALKFEGLRFIIGDTMIMTPNTAWTHLIVMVESSMDMVREDMMDNNIVAYPVQVSTELIGKILYQQQ